jgi:hypothetical protein
MAQLKHLADTLCMLTLFPAAVLQNEAELAQLQELYDMLQLEHQRASAAQWQQLTYPPAAANVLPHSAAEAPCRQKSSTACRFCSVLVPVVLQNEAELAQLQELYDMLQLEHQRAQATPALRLLDEVLDLLGDDPYLPGAKQRGEAVVQRLRSAFMGGGCCCLYCSLVQHGAAESAVAVPCFGRL